jgi:hypothetical protein
MTTTTIRRVPWTCRWGRFGVAVEDAGLAPRVDDVFWACHQPVHELRLTKRGECEHCPHWEAAPNMRPEYY